jgi:hypothetical protein
VKLVHRLLCDGQSASSHSAEQYLMFLQVLQGFVPTSVQRGQICCFFVVCGGAMIAVVRWLVQGVAVVGGEAEEGEAWDVM